MPVHDKPVTTKRGGLERKATHHGSIGQRSIVNGIYRWRCVIKRFMSV